MNRKGVLRAVTSALVLAAFFSGPPTFAADDGPSATAAAFYDFMRQGDYPGAATLFDPKELGDFRNALQVMYQNPTDADQERIRSLFGPDMTIDRLVGMSDAEFFATFLRLVFEVMQPARYFSFDGIDVIGEVYEEELMAHVVVRHSIGIGDGALEVVDVVSVRQSDGDWRILMQANVRDFANAVRQSFESN